MEWNTPENRALIRAILSLTSPEEARRFLRDLMTENEIEEFSKRFQAAQMLSQNLPYSEIEKTTGLSSTTVARVSKWLNGKEGGYRAVIARLHHHSPALARGD
jgi:TrpR-related protein YerC/YecD